MQSELLAVNALLTSIGDTQVNSLDLVHADVESARSIISTTSLDLQSEGWYFNTESWLFNLDRDNKQPLPTNSLYVNTSNINLVKRGAYIYNLLTHTYSLADEDLEDKYYDVVSYLDLDEIPFAAYSLIVTRAKIQYISELESDQSKIDLLLRLAQNQYVQLQKLNLKFLEPNAFQSPTAMKLLYGTQYYNSRRF